MVGSFTAAPQTWRAGGSGARGPGEYHSSPKAFCRSELVRFLFFEKATNAGAMLPQHPCASRSRNGRQPGTCTAWTEGAE